MLQDFLTTLLVDPVVLWGVIIAVAVVGLAAAGAGIAATVRYFSDVEIDPDAARPFGYGTAWIAIANATTDEVVAALNLEHATQHANWYTGLSTVYDAEMDQDFVFVTPPTDGQVFIVGRALPHPVGPRFVDQCRPLLLGLSARFGTVSYFVSHADLALYGWARIEQGRLVRAFAWGDDGAIWNAGPVTPAERDLNLTVLGARADGAEQNGAHEGDDIGYPDEDDVVRMAAYWRADPTVLGAPSGAWDGLVALIDKAQRWRKGAAPSAFGQLALAPRRWRTRPLARMPQLARVSQSATVPDSPGAAQADEAGDTGPAVPFDGVSHLPRGRSQVFAHHHARGAAQTPFAATPVAATPATAELGTPSPTSLQGANDDTRLELGGAEDRRVQEHTAGHEFGHEQTDARLKQGGTQGRRHVPSVAARRDPGGNDTRAAAGSRAGESSGSGRARQNSNVTPLRPVKK